MKRTYGRRNVTPDRRVLYDGWALARDPGSPAALHLLELLEALPECVEPWLALPTEINLELASPARVVVEPIKDGPGSRLSWEQARLPAIARQVKAQLLHTTQLSLPLFSPIPCLVSPAEPIPRDFSRGDLRARLGEALGRGGLSGARAVLWPEDLPPAPLQSSAPILHLPPHVHSAFFQPQPNLLELPEQYVLAPGCLDAAEREYLSAAWSWAAAGLGDEWALLAVDLEEDALEDLRRLCREAGASGPVEQAAADSPRDRAEVFQRAGTVLSVGPVLPWGDPLLQTLACGRPIAATETAWSSARVGPAGYLTPAGDARSLGAAVLTPLVEETVSEQLSQAARERAEKWGREAFAKRLELIYTQFLD